MKTPLAELVRRMNGEVECTLREADEARPRFADHAANHFLELLTAAKALANHYDPYATPGVAENEARHERLKAAISAAESVEIP